jgi:hypothetical protein
MVSGKRVYQPSTMAPAEFSPEAIGERYGSGSYFCSLHQRSGTYVAGATFEAAGVPGVPSPAAQTPAAPAPAASSPTGEVMQMMVLMMQSAQQQAANAQAQMTQLLTAVIQRPSESALEKVLPLLARDRGSVGDLVEAVEGVMRMTGSNSPQQQNSGGDDALAEVAKAVLPHVLAEKSQARPQQQQRPTASSVRKQLLIQRERARRVLAATDARLLRMQPIPTTASAAPAASSTPAATEATPTIRLVEPEASAKPTSAAERLEQVRAWMDIGADPDKCAQIVIDDGDDDTLQQIEQMQPSQMAKLLGAALGVSDAGDVMWVEEFARRCKVQFEQQMRESGEDQFDEADEGEDGDDERDQT